VYEGSIKKLTNTERGEKLKRGNGNTMEGWTWSRHTACMKLSQWNLPVLFMCDKSKLNFKKFPRNFESPSMKNYRWKFNTKIISTNLKRLLWIAAVVLFLTHALPLKNSMWKDMESPLFKINYYMVMSFTLQWISDILLTLWNFQIKIRKITTD
jgi:hypothetical protein